MGVEEVIVILEPPYVFPKSLVRLKKHQKKQKKKERGKRKRKERKKIVYGKTIFTYGL